MIKIYIGTEGWSASEYAPDDCHLVHTVNIYVRHAHIQIQSKFDSNTRITLQHNAHVERIW